MPRMSAFFVKPSAHGPGQPWTPPQAAFLNMDHEDEHECLFLVSVDELGTPGLWASVKDLLESRAILHNLTLHNKLGRAVLVERLTFKFVGTGDRRLQRLRPFLQSPAVWFRFPYAHVLLVTTADVTEYRSVVKPALKRSIAMLEQEWGGPSPSGPPPAPLSGMGALLGGGGPSPGGGVLGAEWLVVYVRPSELDVVDKGAKRVYEKLKDDFAVRGRTRVLRIDPPKGYCAAALAAVAVGNTGSSSCASGTVPGSSWGTPRGGGLGPPHGPPHAGMSITGNASFSALASIGNVLGLDELEGCLKECVRASFESRKAAYMAEVQRLANERRDPAWSFESLYLVKDTLAMLLDGCGMHLDAYKEYVELEAAYQETLDRKAATRGAGPEGTGEGEDVFGASAKRADVATLTSASWRVMRRAVVERAAVQEFRFRQYLFAAQARLLLRLGRPVDVAERGLRFIAALAGELGARGGRRGDGGAGGGWPWESGWGTLNVIRQTALPSDPQAWTFSACLAVLSSVAAGVMGRDSAIAATVLAGSVTTVPGTTGDGAPPGYSSMDPGTDPGIAAELIGPMPASAVAAATAGDPLNHGSVGPTAHSAAAMDRAQAVDWQLWVPLPGRHGMEALGDVPRLERQALCGYATSPGALDNWASYGQLYGGGTAPGNGPRTPLEPEAVLQKTTFQAFALACAQLYNTARCALLNLAARAAMMTPTSVSGTAHSTTHSTASGGTGSGSTAAPSEGATDAEEFLAAWRRGLLELAGQYPCRGVVGGFVDQEEDRQFEATPVQQFTQMQLLRAAIAERSTPGGLAGAGSIPGGVGPLGPENLSVSLAPPSPSLASGGASFLTPRDINSPAANSTVWLTPAGGTSASDTGYVSSMRRGHTRSESLYSVSIANIGPTPSTTTTTTDPFGPDMPVFPAPGGTSRTGSVSRATLGATGGRGSRRGTSHFFWDVDQQPLRGGGGGGTGTEMVGWEEGGSGTRHQHSSSADGTLGALFANKFDLLASKLVPNRPSSSARHSSRPQRLGEHQQSTTATATAPTTTTTTTTCSPARDPIAAAAAAASLIAPSAESSWVAAPGSPSQLSPELSLRLPAAVDWLSEWRLRVAMSSAGLCGDLAMQLALAAADCYSLAGRHRSAADLYGDVGAALMARSPGEAEVVARRLEHVASMALAEGWYPLLGRTLPVLMAAQQATSNVFLPYTCLRYLSLPPRVCQADVRHRVLRHLLSSAGCAPPPGQQHQQHADGLGVGGGGVAGPPGGLNTSVNNASCRPRRSRQCAVLQLTTMQALQAALLPGCYSRFYGTHPTTGLPALVPPPRHPPAVSEGATIPTAPGSSPSAAAAVAATKAGGGPAVQQAGGEDSKDTTTTGIGKASTSAQGRADKGSIGGGGVSGGATISRVGDVAVVRLQLYSNLPDAVSLTDLHLVLGRLQLPEIPQPPHSLMPSGPSGGAAALAVATNTTAAAATAAAAGGNPMPPHTLRAPLHSHSGVMSSSISLSQHPQTQPLTAPYQQQPQQSHHASYTQLQPQLQQPLGPPSGSSRSLSYTHSACGGLANTPGPLTQGLLGYPPSFVQSSQQLQPSWPQQPLHPQHQHVVLQPQSLSRASLSSFTPGASLNAAPGIGTSVSQGGLLAAATQGHPPHPTHHRHASMGEGLGSFGFAGGGGGGVGGIGTTAVAVTPQMWRPQPPPATVGRGVGGGTGTGMITGSTDLIAAGPSGGLASAVASAVMDGCWTGPQAYPTPGPTPLPHATGQVAQQHPHAHLQAAYQISAPASYPGLTPAATPAPSYGMSATSYGYMAAPPLGVQPPGSPSGVAAAAVASTSRLMALGGGGVAGGHRGGSRLERGLSLNSNTLPLPSAGVGVSSVGNMSEAAVAYRRAPSWGDTLSSATSFTQPPPGAISLAASSVFAGPTGGVGGGRVSVGELQQQQPGGGTGSGSGTGSGGGGGGVMSPTSRPGTRGGGGTFGGCGVSWASEDDLTCYHLVEVRHVVDGKATCTSATHSLPYDSRVVQLRPGLSHLVFHVAPARPGLYFVRQLVASLGSYDIRIPVVPELQLVADVRTLTSANWEGLKRVGGGAAGRIFGRDADEDAEGGLSVLRRELYGLPSAGAAAVAEMLKGVGQVADGDVRHLEIALQVSPLVPRLHAAPVLLGAGLAAGLPQWLGVLLVPPKGGAGAAGGRNGGQEGAGGGGSGGLRHALVHVQPRPHSPLRVGEWLPPTAVTPAAALSAVTSLVRPTTAGPGGSASAAASVPHSPLAVQRDNPHVLTFDNHPTCESGGCGGGPYSAFGTATTAAATALLPLPPAATTQGPVLGGSSIRRADAAGGQCRVAVIDLRRTAAPGTTTSGHSTTTPLASPRGPSAQPGSTPVAVSAAGCAALEGGGVCWMYNGRQGIDVSQALCGGSLRSPVLLWVPVWVPPAVVGGAEDKAPLEVPPEVVRVQQAHAGVTSSRHPAMGLSSRHLSRMSTQQQQALSGSHRDLAASGGPCSLRQLGHGGGRLLPSCEVEVVVEGQSGGVWRSHATCLSVPLVEPFRVRTTAHQLPDSHILVSVTLNSALLLPVALTAITLQPQYGLKLASQQRGTDAGDGSEALWGATGAVPAAAVPGGLLPLRVLPGQTVSWGFMLSRSPDTLAAPYLSSHHSDDCCLLQLSYLVTHGSLSPPEAHELPPLPGHPPLGAALCGLRGPYPLPPLGGTPTALGGGGSVTMAGAKAGSVNGEGGAAVCSTELPPPQPPGAPPAPPALPGCDLMSPAALSGGGGVPLTGACGNHGGSGVTVGSCPNIYSHTGTYSAMPPGLEGMELAGMGVALTGTQIFTHGFALEFAASNALTHNLVSVRLLGPYNAVLGQPVHLTWLVTRVSAPPPGGSGDEGSGSDTAVYEVVETLGLRNMEEGGGGGAGVAALGGAVGGCVGGVGGQDVVGVAAGGRGGGGTGVVCHWRQGVGCRGSLRLGRARGSVAVVEAVVVAVAAGPVPVPVLRLRGLREVREEEGAAAEYVMVT